MTRIAITGGPKTGKTTLADQMWNGIAVAAGAADPMKRGLGIGIVRHTDDLIGTHEWSDASAEVAHWFDAPGPWIIEGVAVSRALRKWRDQHPGERPPVDRVIYLVEPHVDLTKAQTAMAKGVEKVHAEIEEWLGFANERHYKPVISEGIARPDLRGRVRFEP